MNLQCDAIDCDKNRYHKSIYCVKHNARFKRHGSPYKVKHYFDPSPEEWRAFLLSKISMVNGCWIWKGAFNNKGYGRLSSTKYAHREFWKSFRGDIPKNMNVLHKCDNPPCVNPDHLFLGTHQDNVDDKIKKGRMPLGVARSNSKLNPRKVRMLRKLRGVGFTWAQLAEKMSVSISAARQAVDGRSWRHV